MKILFYVGLNNKGQKEQQVIEVPDYEANEWLIFGLEQGYEIDESEPIQKQIQHIVDKTYEEQYNQDRREFRHIRKFRTLIDNEGNEINEVDTIVDDTPNYLEETIEKETSILKEKAINEFMNGLTKVQKTRLDLKMKGLTLKEIAEKEGVSIRSIRDSLDQLKTRYKEILKKYEI